MPPRASARMATRSASRDLASSPPKSSKAPQPQRPTGRRTRSTRSQSADLDEGIHELPTSGRRARQPRAIVESDESEEIEWVPVSSNNARPSGKAHAPARKSPDLSIVAENPELEEDDEDGDEGEEDGDEGEEDGDEGEEDGDEDDDEEEYTYTGRHLRSPGGASQASQMSGTTAITSASALTSHSIEEIEDLDPVMVEYLPELFASSSRILNSLAPLEASAEVVESILRELKVLGSRRAKRLKHDEEKFRIDRAHYGSDDYINPSYIVRRLFGIRSINIENIRPDPILHVANIATLVKDLLVTPRGNQGTRRLLQVADTYFPEEFLRGFDEHVNTGHSQLLNESFELGLEIRTQCAIIALLYHKEAEDWNPEAILLSIFYPTSWQLSQQFPYFKDVLEHGDVMDIMRAGPANSEEQDNRVKSRVVEIHDTFQQNNDIQDAGDLVDFERLDELFPWTGFLTQLVQWSRLRLDEILLGLGEQGGVEHVVKSLIQTVKDSNTQVELEYDPPVVVPRRIIPSNPGQNLYNKNAVLDLERMKQKFRSGSAPKSRQAQPGPQPVVSFPPSANQARPPKSSATQPAKVPAVTRQTDVEPIEHIVFGMGDDDEFDVGGARSTQEYISSWDKNRRDKNKENRPVADKQGTTSDRASTVYSQSTSRGHDREASRRHDRDESSRFEGELPLFVEEDVEDLPPLSSLKRARPDDEADEESEDEGFQDDTRCPDPARRAAAARAQGRSVQPPRKRARTEPAIDAVESVRRRQELAERFLQASCRREDNEDVEEGGLEEANESRSDVSGPTVAQVKALAKYTSRSGLPPRPTQKRTKWPAADEQRLKSLIEERGCRWSEIEGPAAEIFDHPRDQLALRDKARNMKVNYLIARVPLPTNFEDIALGPKEIDKVRSVIPDYVDRQ